MVVVSPIERRENAAGNGSSVFQQMSNQTLSIEERFKATLKLASLPRDGSKTRVRNRCEVSGRPRAYYRKLRMSRIALRELGNFGKVPGIVKSSW